MLIITRFILYTSVIFDLYNIIHFCNIYIFRFVICICETKYLPLYIHIKDLYFCEISMLCTQL